MDTPAEVWCCECDRPSVETVGGNAYCPTHYVVAFALSKVDTRTNPQPKYARHKAKRDGRFYRNRRNEPDWS